MELTKLREGIDIIDQNILRMLNERAELAEKIGIEKKKQNLPITNENREQQVIQKLIKLNNGPLSDEAIERIFNKIIFCCRTLQKDIS